MKKKNIFLLICVVLIILILSSGFYWYEFRPTKIRKECNSTAVEGAKELAKPTGSGLDKLLLGDKYSVEDYEKIYLECLRSKGLNK